ncbi:hypothetical protein DIC66_11780 [Rhodoferax lacus]|uniref:Uncharacterized protein n=1 Tax=Rhodoferax lacus TaxID=2184758 RepID=A0A3E1RCB8_9BURK|nr:hypothetical protein [Rhodoferax lacus]RFO96692.1 hypothetical protein DIC66_11780 [Rhodoferax lacus]
MATTPKCDATGILNEAQASCVKTHAAGLIPVEYEIHLDTNLRLPYAIYWNGETQPANRVALTTGGAVATVRIMARSGQKVGLYLGSDASPQFRQEMLFPITVGHNDVRIVIHSVTGQHDHEAEVSSKETDIQRDMTEAGRADKLDIYRGNFLTGNTWLKFSHKYTVAESLALAADAGEVDAGILAALRAIYGGDVSKTSGYTVAFAGKHSCKLSFQAGVDSNCVQNILRYLSLGGFSGAALPRVHPRSWVALLQAARDANVGSLEITSGWRPMTGKSPHRIGLGLDIKSAKSVSGTTLVFDKDNANLWSSPEEKVAHRDWTESEAELDKAHVEMAAAQKAAKAAKEEGKALAQQREDEAKKRLTKALLQRDLSKAEYAKNHKGTFADTLEQTLLKNPLIRQVFEPLVMDANTRDKLEPEVNRYRLGNEATHKNHLHVTAVDSYLIP